jgi:tetratricopeptide (TPR) repeat protein
MQNAPASRIPIWPWIVAGALGALIVSQLLRQRTPDDFRARDSGPERRAPRIEPRQLSDAVYLRFIQDEGTRSSEEKLQRAIAGVARARELTPESVREALGRFAAEVEANPVTRNDYEATVAAMIRGRFDAPQPDAREPADALAAPLQRITAHIVAKDWPQAEAALVELRRRTDRGRDAESYARVQAAAFHLRYAQDRLDEAFTIAREVRDIREHVLPPDSPGVARALENVAVCLARTGQDDQAVPLYQRALAIYEKVYGPEDIDVADTASELAAALADSGQLREAEAAARRAIPIFERAGEDQALRLALTLDRLGYALLIANRNADAETALRRAVAIYDRRPDARAKDHSDAVHRLAQSIARQDRRREALPYFKRSTEIGAKWFADDDPLFAVLFHNMAVWADGAGDDPLTVASYERALQILAKNQRRTKQEPAQMRQTKEFYAAYLKRAGLSASEIDRKLREATD